MSPVNTLGRQWIGRGNGDQRVVSYSNGRVYSCPEVIAYVFSIHIKDLIACCNRYVREVEGLKFDWYAQYRLENPNGDIKPRKIEIVPVTRPKIDPKITVQGKYRRSFYTLVRFYYPHLYKIISSFSPTGDPVTVLVSRLDDLLSKSLREEGSSKRTTPRALAAHLKSKIRIYEKLFDLRFTTLWSERGRREALAVSVRPKSEVSVDSVVVDAFSGYIRRARHTKSKPIMRMETKTLYSGVNDARKRTGISARLIRWSCLGELEDFHRDDEKVTFRYVKFL
jgi:hypothetical protein